MTRNILIILMIILLIIIVVIIAGLLLLFGGLGVGAYFIIKKMSNFIKTVILITGYIVISFAGIIIYLIATGFMLGSVFTIIGIPIGFLIVVLSGVIYVLGLLVGGIFLYELGHNYDIGGWQYPVHILLMLLIPGYGFGLPFQYAMYMMGGQPYAVKKNK